MESRHEGVCYRKKDLYEKVIVFNTGTGDAVQSAARERTGSGGEGGG